MFRAKILKISCFPLKFSTFTDEQSLCMGNFSLCTFYIRHQTNFLRDHVLQTKICKALGDLKLVNKEIGIRKSGKVLIEITKDVRNGRLFCNCFNCNFTRSDTKQAVQ